METSSHPVKFKLYLHLNCSQVQNEIINIPSQIVVKLTALQMLQKSHGSRLMKSNLG